MVMRFLSGGSLMDRIQRHGNLHAIQAIDATIDMLKGLAHAHENRVIHRDIKPHNLLISNEGVVQISDFGIARAEDSGSDMTQTGAVLGTLCYMSPEQRRDSKTCTERSDLFSAGATFFTLLTNEQPMDVSFVSIQDELFKDLDDDIDVFLRKACHANPEERHQSASEMIEELERIKENRGPLPEDVTPIFVPGELGDISSIEDDPGHQSIIKAISQSSEGRGRSHREIEQDKTQTPTLYPDDENYGDDTGTIFFDDLDANDIDDQEEVSATPETTPTQVEPSTHKPSNNRLMMIMAFILVAIIVGVVLLPSKDTKQMLPRRSHPNQHRPLSQTLSPTKPMNN